MKLELKHLAPYLPYGLKNQRAFHKPKVIDGIVGNKVYFGDTVLFINQIEPILRPLSDLTKEIKVNGNLFTPNHHPLFKIFISADMDWFIDNCPFFVDYGQVQKLLEWHFDIFGLIELGLAIDINTI